jgi:hypothetical protein
MSLVTRLGEFPDVSDRERRDPPRMHPIEDIRTRQLPDADHPSLDANPGIEAGTAIALGYLPIGPGMLLVALATFAFLPAFAAIALVVVAGALLALPFLLVRHFVARR